MIIAGVTKPQIIHGVNINAINQRTQQQNKSDFQLGQAQNRLFLQNVSSTYDGAERKFKDIILRNFW